MRLLLFLAKRPKRWTHASGTSGIKEAVGSASSSCAIAALNIVETDLDAGVGKWCTSTSPFFRNRALRDLIIYHVTASRHGTAEPYDKWVKPCVLPGPEDPSIDYGPVGYNDFNLDAPNVFHPIHRFLRVLRHDSNSKFIKSNREPEPIALAPLLSSFSELPQAPSSRIVLNLAPTPEPKTSDVTDLCTPSPAPKPRAPKKEVADDVIDLTLSPMGCRPLPRRVLAFLKLKSDPDTIMFDSDSLDQLPRSDSHKENSMVPPKVTDSDRSVDMVDAVRVGSFFPTFELGQAAVYGREARFGHIWRVGQTKRASDGSKRRVSLRCNDYGDPNAATHSDDIDPSDHRAGRTIRTNCSAHVDLAVVPGGGWHVTLIDRTHNHPAQLVSQYAASGNFTRSHLSHILRARFPDHILEPRQVSNLLNASRKEANDEIMALGGDFQSVLGRLRELKEEDPRWDWDVLLDEHQVVVGLWWQSQAQAELAIRFYDVLINDNTYCRNQYGYPLNIGIAIDSHGSTRNIWYAVHRSEDIETHNWVFSSYLRGARRPPEVLGSDRHPSIIASASDKLPLTFHFYCLHHLGGNVETNLRLALGADWDNLKRDFWAVYRAVSPVEFERQWNDLTTKYPSASKYLDEELYPCRHNGQGENRINKAIGGPKKTFLQLFNGLNERTGDQTAKDLIQVRQSSRRRHESNLESLFAAPLKMIRDHAGTFALQTCYVQMQESLFYSTEVVQRPNEVHSWNEYALKLTSEHGFEWMPGEKKQMLNPFNNDKAHVSLQRLIALVTKRGLTVRHLLRVKHESTANLGIPCRHFFRIWVDVQNLPFHISLIRPRWLQNPDFAIESVAAVTRTRELAPRSFSCRQRPFDLRLHPIPSTAPHMMLPPASHSNYPIRDVFHNVQAAIRPLIAAFKTSTNEMWMKRAVSVSWIHLSSLIRAGHVPVGLQMHGRADNEAEVSPAPLKDRVLAELTSAVCVARRATIDPSARS
ncbi:hypothetical protein B0H13DRAFT_2377898 [Mycena leptocephala]|nr:hypothetical protein B0H13DRAFT_2377898 [Mycena leptocephala]